MRFTTSIKAGLAAAVLVGLAAVARPAATQPFAPAPALVSPAWLQANLERADLRIVDLGKSRADFEQAHVPNAHWVDWRVELADPARPGHFDVLRAEAFEALMSRLGVTPDTTLVLYDSQQSRLAARMFWTLRYYGHANARILDGGWGAWQASGGATTPQTTEVRPTDYRVERVNSPLRAQKADVTALVGRADAAIVDARATEFYSGAATGSPFGSDVPNAKQGHVRGAQSFFWADHVNEDGTYKSVSELRAQYEALGITPDRTVVTYCHVGLQASTPWFVLSELLGYPDVRLYDSSMAEWANAADTELVLSGEN